MGVLASVNCYTTRVNLSVTVVVMVNHTWLAEELEHDTPSVHYYSPCMPHDTLDNNGTLDNNDTDDNFSKMDDYDYDHDDPVRYSCCGMLPRVIFVLN